MTTVLLAGGGTGGHLMPALAVASATRELHPDWRFVFAGAQRGVEAQILPARELPHYLLPLEPIYRQQWWKNFRWPLLLPKLLGEIDRMLDAEKPNVVVGTGGYASGPVLWRAAKRGIPIAVLDLDVKPGIATRWLSRRAKEIWVATPEAINGIPEHSRNKVIVTGAPITPPDFSRREAAYTKWGFDPSQPTLVVTGGSQGSLAINRAVAEWLKSGGLGEAQLIWATGKSSYSEFEHFAANPASPRLRVMSFVDPMSDAWAVADLCVARAGMMTIAELCAWGIASVLIPLPTAAADHQTYNARAMEQAGAAVLLRQSDLNANELGRVLTSLLKESPRRESMQAAARARGRGEAAMEIAGRVTLLASTGS